MFHKFRNHILRVQQDKSGAVIFGTNIIIHKEGTFGDPDLAPFEDSRTSSEMVLDGPNLYLSHH